jgi:hypothetical protein
MNHLSDMLALLYRWPLLVGGGGSTGVAVNAVVTDRGGNGIGMRRLPFLSTIPL